MKNQKIKSVKKQTENIAHGNEVDCSEVTPQENKNLENYKAFFQHLLSGDDNDDKFPDEDNLFME